MNEKLVLNSLTGKMFEPVPIKTYDEVLMDIENWSLNIANGVNGYGVHWSSEYSEWNHEKMTEIVRILDECTQEDVCEMLYYLGKVYAQQTPKKEWWPFLLGGDEKKVEKLRDKLRRIRNIGQEIHDRGGFTAMQANFYIFFNILIPHNPAERAVKFRDIKYLWDGLGEWKE